MSCSPWRSGNTPPNKKKKEENGLKIICTTRQAAARISDGNTGLEYAVSGSTLTERRII